MIFLVMFKYIKQLKAYLKALSEIVVNFMF